VDAVCKSCGDPMGHAYFRLDLLDNNKLQSDADLQNYLAVHFPLNRWGQDNQWPGSFGYFTQYALMAPPNNTIQYAIENEFYFLFPGAPLVHMIFIGSLYLDDDFLDIIRSSIKVSPQTITNLATSTALPELP